LPRKPKDTALAVSESGSTHWRGSAALQRVFETVPRDEIIQALVDSGDNKAVQLAERLSDGAHSRTNLARHCAKVGILPKDVWTILIETRKLATRLRISERLPEVAEAVIDAAVASEIACPACFNAKLDSPCTYCGGAGRVTRPGDKDAQKMALEIAEMLGKQGPLVANQYNFGGKGPVQVNIDVPDMSDWSRSTDKVFEEATGEIIEAEVVKNA
jgi:hypothetical protein